MPKQEETKRPGSIYLPESEQMFLQGLCI
ncbi:hypothetical protein LEMLEM_LOCUS23953 [Lemmus lemmus]